MDTPLFCIGLGHPGAQVPELAQRKAEHLRARMAEANARKRCVRQLPAVTAVDRWIKQAKSLPRVVKY